jgi:hypothetical protein
MNVRINTLPLTVALLTLLASAASVSVRIMDAGILEGVRIDSFEISASGGMTMGDEVTFILR